jgi:hypothetical protein
MKQAELITPLDIAKHLGVEEEYKEKLIEQELKKTREDFEKSEVVELKNNTME